MKLLHNLLAKLTGRNNQYTPVDLIIDQLNEPRPLPMGSQEFEEWSERIIAGACMPCKIEDEQIFHDSQKFSIAEMIMHLGPTESHKEDAYFIHSLRKAAANQVAHAKMIEIRDKAKKRLAEQEASKKEANAAIESSVQNSATTVVPEAS